MEINVDPDVWRAWIRIARDFALVAVGAFMLVYETVAAPSPDPYVIAGGLAALGLPPAIRLDLKRKPDDDTK